MKALAVTYPDNFELAVSTTLEELEAQVRLMAALKMFELGKLSAGKAAELAGMSRVSSSRCAAVHTCQSSTTPPKTLRASSKGTERPSTRCKYDVVSNTGRGYWLSDDLLEAAAKFAGNSSGQR